MSGHHKWVTVGDALDQLIKAGCEVVMGARKAPGSSGFYVALEHQSLDEPIEFYAGTLRVGLEAARAWSTANIPKRRETAGG